MDYTGIGKKKIELEVSCLPKVILTITIVVFICISAKLCGVVSLYLL